MNMQNKVKIIQESPMLEGNLSLLLKKKEVAIEKCQFLEV